MWGDCLTKNKFKTITDTADEECILKDGDGVLVLISEN